jgi:hypothetical protein
MPSDFEALRAERQQRLVDFLKAELGLAPTFVQSALLAKGLGHMDHYAQSKQNATKAAKSIRHFMSQIADAKIRTEIGEQLAELDRLISTL